MNSLINSFNAFADAEVLYNRLTGNSRELSYCELENKLHQQGYTMDCKPINKNLNNDGTCGPKG